MQNYEASTQRGDLPPSQQNISSPRQHHKKKRQGAIIWQIQIHHPQNLAMNQSNKWPQSVQIYNSIH